MKEMLNAPEGATVARVWHGYATKENAPKYWNVLQNHTLPGIERDAIVGLLGYHVFRKII